MSTATSKSRLSEEHKIPTADNCYLCAVTMRPRPSTPPRRVALIVPLAGAGAGQQLMVFRDFARRGAIAVSYEYRGHPRSTGKFDLDSTIVDTHHALKWALDYAGRLGLPLHGFTTCYGAIPLLAQFKPGRLGPGLRSVTTISGLYHLHQIMGIEGFTPYVSRRLGRQMDAGSLVAAIEQGTLDCDSLPLRQALSEYLLSLMPELRVDDDRFEELRYNRIDMREMLLQFSQADYLKGAMVPPTVPCTVVMGRNDWLLRTDTEDGREKYRNLVRAVAPHAEFCELDMDHYGEGPDHERMARAGGDAFERAEAAPAPCDLEVPRFRRLPR